MITAGIIHLIDNVVDMLKILLYLLQACLINCHHRCDTLRRFSSENQVGFLSEIVILFEQDTHNMHAIPRFPKPVRHRFSILARKYCLNTLPFFIRNVNTNMPKNIASALLLFLSVLKKYFTDLVFYKIEPPTPGRRDTLHFKEFMDICNIFKERHL